MADYYASSSAAGGGAGTVGDPYTLAELLTNTTTDGDIGYIMNDGTYSRTGNWNITVLARVRFVGAHSDGTPYNESGGSKPLFQVSSGSAFTVIDNSGRHAAVEGIRVDGNGAANIKGFDMRNRYNRVIDCEADDCATGFDDSEGISRGTKHIGCYANDCTNGFICSAGTPGCFEFCEAEACGTGFGGTIPATAFMCVAHDGTGSGFNNNYYCTNCISYNNSGDGFDLNNNTQGCINCIAYGNGSAGYETAGFEAAHLINCAGGSNTAGNYASADLNNIRDFVSLTADPFTDAAGGDFSLNNTAGGGADLRGAGWQVFRNSTGYIDIGAVQTQVTESVESPSSRNIFLFGGLAVR